MFRFADPDMLYLLLLIPVMIVVWGFYIINRRRRIGRFGLPSTLQKLMPEASPSRVTRKFIILLIAVAMIVIGLARPQLGSKLKEVTHEGVEMMLAVDVSNSMLAQDIEPSRLERTKYAINRLLENLGQDRVGLVAFAGDAFVLLPVTADAKAARNFVKQLAPDMVSRQGTNIGAAINLASNSFSSDSEGARVIILITDGEDHDDATMEAAKNAEKKGIKIYAIGIGTPEGSPIPIDGDLMKDDKGQIVVTKLNEQLLQKLSLQSGGAYIRANNTSLGLSEIVAKIKETEGKKMRTTMFEEFNEQYQYFIGAALLLLLLEFLILPRKNRLLARFEFFK